MVSVSNLINGGLLLVGQEAFQNLASPEQASVDLYNLLRYLGGSAPYIQRQGYGISTDLPDGCEYQQVQLLSRHGERYPSKSSGKQYKKLLNKLQGQNITFKGSLSFLNNYEYFVPNDDLLEKETTPMNSQGLYSGTTDALKHGASFRAKYKSLYTQNSTLPVFSSNSGRVYLTSRYFVRGFLGDDFSDNIAKFNVLSEDASSGANSLTPREGCSDFKKSEQDKSFSDDYLENIVDRLQDENKGLKISKDDVENLFGYCAFEINVRGSSPFCDIFTNEDLVKFSYANDVSYYYSNGPGNNKTLPVSSPLINATLSLLKDDLNENKVWLQFTHDTDIEIFHAALGIINPKEDLSTDHIEFPDPYVHSSIVPQGSRTYTEKYQCGDSSYVRYILNDAVIPIESCSDGPGFSCKLEDFEDYINSRINGVDYDQECSNPSSTPDKVTFFWDYDQKNYTAPLLDS